MSMRVLFVCSQNDPRYKVAPFIKAQGESLEEEGIELDYFLVKGKGLRNYLRNISLLQDYLKDNPVDVIHAHYSLCGMVAVLATRKIPIVVSFMGDDVLGTLDKHGHRTLKSRLIMQIARLIQPFTKGLIAKSPNIYRKIYRKSIAHLIPNGVQLDKFNIQTSDNRKKLGLRSDKQYVLFLANPKDLNKNVALAREALEIINRPDVELLTVFAVPHTEVQAYLHAADVMVLCSFSEGSPNVVKEAMACNRPIVATRVGDVEQLLDQTTGSYLSSHEPTEFARQLEKALTFAQTVGKTNGRTQLIAKGLDSKTIAWRIIDIYNHVCTTNQLVMDKKPSKIKKVF